MSAAASAPVKKYRFYRSDFGALDTRPLHINLDFDVLPSRVIGRTTTTFVHVGATPLTRLKLDSVDLEVSSVERINAFNTLPNKQPYEFADHIASFSTQTTPLQYTVDNAAHALYVDLNEPVAPNTQFVLRVVSVAKPTPNILEGFYYDWTPTEAPQTIITQCQQHGFQRMVPAVDEMAAKCYYTTTITADMRYTHIITNGDLASHCVDQHNNARYLPPVHSPPDAADVKRHSVVYYNHKVNMASYLFFLGCGTYDCYRAEVEYADGNKFDAELLVFPGLVKKHHAQTALKALVDSIYWCYLSTGPEATEHEPERKQLYELIARRDAMKEAGAADAELAPIRAQLKQLISVFKKTGYQYTARIYREISMQNSDYGGMENVGNTTILASRMVPSDLLSDPAYLYMEGVKIHEYYHNINGSQVTGQSPFEIWLNEAVTVHIQRQREAVLFGADFMRLKEVLYSFMAGQGPLAVDKSANSMAIEPEGFNRTQELVSAMTYSKAPEFVRMVELFLGYATFNKGLDHYHTKFAYSNATTADWIHSMEHASGMDLTPMAAGWLKRTGHPHVDFTTSWDEASKQLKVEMEQSGFTDGKPWIFPIDWATVQDGRVVKEGIFRLDAARASFTVPSDTKPDFLSFARGWSFFGTYHNKSDDEQALVKQALTDPDIVNRYFAYRHVADVEKENIVRALLRGDNNYAISSKFVDLHATILFSSLNAGARSLILKENDDLASRPELSHHYWELSHARTAMLQAVWDKYGDKVSALYNELESQNVPGPHLHGLHNRSLKQHLYSIMFSGTVSKPVLAHRNKTHSADVNVAALAKQLIKSTFMSDRSFGFIQYLSGSEPIAEKEKVLAAVRDEWAQHPDTIEVYVSCISSVDGDDAPRLIREMMQQSFFDINQAGHARTLARMWSMNRKRSLLTSEGLDLTAELFIKIGYVNQYSAQSFIASLNDLPKFKGESLEKLLSVLRRVKAQLDPVKTESLFNQMTTLLSTYPEHK